MQILTDFPLNTILFYKIGGIAKTVLKIENKEDLSLAMEYIAQNKPRHVLPVGLGANLLMSDTVFDGVVLWFCKAESDSIQIHSDGLLEIFTSVTLDDVIQFSFENNLIGLEWAGGLPSSVGAAVRGNVGCFGHEIQDVVEKVSAYDMKDSNSELRDLRKDELRFGYRNSLLKQNKNMIVSSVWLQLKSANSEEIEKAKQVYQENIDYRASHHPIEYPSCGSVFKNITDPEAVEKIASIWPDAKESIDTKWHGKVSMGYVINRFELSGYRVGGAQISQKHANYISNIDHAKFDDVYSIIKLISQRFFEAFGFYPEPEVEIISG